MVVDEEKRKLVQRKSDVKNFSPFALKSGNIFEIVERDGGFVVESGVRAKEVVISDEEGGESDSTVFGVEAVSGEDVEFVSAVEAFDELFERTEFG